MSRKQPTPPPKGIKKPKPPPGPPNLVWRMGKEPPGPHWWKMGDRNRSKPPHSVDKDASDVISIEVPADLVILVASECLKAAIERSHREMCEREAKRTKGG